MRVAFFPNSWRENPYLDLLEESLGKVGVDVFPVEVDQPYRYWLSQHRSEIDVLHFHWLNPFYSANSRRSTLVSALKLFARLSFAKLLGYRIVWTMHNLYPHEQRHPQLDQLVRWFFAHVSDSIVVHCEIARNLLTREFGRQKNVYVAKLGNYAGMYPNAVTKTESRTWLGIDNDAFVFLSLGGIRRYRGLTNLIDAFRQVPATNAALIIAGGSTDSTYLPEIMKVAEIDSRVFVRPGWIPDAELQYYYGAADVVVCPFERVLTSSSAMLAMSFARPVVAPDLGCLPELISSDCGVLYEYERPEGLVTALRQCLVLDVDQMGHAAYDAMQTYSWLEMASVVREAYLD